MRSPRQSKLTPRDVRALEFIGRAGEAETSQVRQAVFSGGTRTSVYRSIRRLADGGLIRTSREGSFSEKHLRLTTRGLAILVDQGFPESELFVLRRPLGFSVTRHRLLVVDLLAVLSVIPGRPERVLPHWLLERRLNPRPSAIPDLLAIWSAVPGGRPAVVAFEVDLGTESLKSVLAPKLTRVQRFLEESMTDAVRQIEVLFDQRSRLVAAGKSQNVGRDPGQGVAVNCSLITNPRGASRFEDITEVCDRAVRTIAQKRRRQVQ